MFDTYISINVYDVPFKYKEWTGFNMYENKCLTNYVSIFEGDLRKKGREN